MRLIILIIFAIMMAGTVKAQALNPCGLTVEQLKSSSEDFLGWEKKDGVLHFYLLFDETISDPIINVYTERVTGYTLHWLDEEENEWYSDKIKCNN